MHSITFDDLVALVPTWTVPISPQEHMVSAESVAGLPHFVRPNFRQEGESLNRLGSELPRVLLVSAPAAVGKSSLARNLCAETKNPYWDLSKFNVGSNFFTGTIAKRYGSDNFGTFVKTISSGHGCLVLDAADEAVVRAGMDNFEQALVDLYELIANGFGLSVVILGRPDTIADTGLALSKLGISHSALEVEFFSEQQTRDFVESKLAASGKRAPALELHEFLSNFFAEVQRALGVGPDWKESASFLGYAPVLDALVTFYESAENGKLLLERLKRADSTAHVWDLLVEVVRTVCERETEKFAASFGGEDLRKREFAAETYSTSAQIARLVAEQPSFLPLDFPDDGESEWLEELEDQVDRQFKVHPFLVKSNDGSSNPLENFANVAFRDFAIAYAFLVGDADDAARISAYTTSSTYNPSPLLSRFIFADEMPRSEGLPLAAFGAVVDSNSAGGNISGSSIVLDECVDSPSMEDPVSTAKKAFESFLLERGAVQGVLRWEAEDNESIELLREAANLTIYALGERIVAGSGFADFVVGPNVVIQCRSIEFLSSELRVRGDASSVVEIWAESIHGRVRRIAAPVQAALRVNCESAFFPWQTYVQKPVIERWSSSSLYEAGMEFRRLAAWFTRKSMNRGGMRYPAGAMDTILSKGRAPKAVFEYCRHINCLKKEGQEYVFKLPFSVPVFMQNDLCDYEYKKFLEGYLHWLGYEREV